MPEFIGEVVRRRNPFIIRLSIIAAIGGFLFGYDSGIISGAQPYIVRSYGLGDFGQSWLVGSLLVGAIVGAVVAGWLADAISRRWTLVAAGILYILGALACGLAISAVWLIAWRMVLGLAVGAASFVAPMYISEHAPKSIRGGVTTFNQMMVTFGILLAYIAADLLKGFDANWRWMLAFGAVPGIVLAAGLFTVPYSPRWLVEHNRSEEAKQVMRRTRSEHEIQDEVAEIADVSSAQRHFRLRDMVGRRVRPMLVVGLALAFFQQVIGINTVIYYSTTILGYTGLSTSGSIQQALSVGITNFVFTVIAVLLLDRIGRRPMLLIGTVGTVIGLVVLGFWFYLPALQNGYSWVALAALIFYIAAYAVGLGPVFWLMISEIFPMRVRSKSEAVCSTTNWLFNFLVSYFFLQLVAMIGQAGTFWLYAGLGVLAVIFFAIRVPETSDRSLEEISRQIGGVESAKAA
jgi:sugar porter (SP) family MFS transporter